MAQKRYAISLKERVSYAIGDVGCNFVWSTVASFLTLYYTDCVGIAAAGSPQSAGAGPALVISMVLDGEL